MEKVRVIGGGFENCRHAIAHEDSVSVNSIVSRKNDVNQIVFLYFHMNHPLIVQGFLKY